MKSLVSLFANLEYGKEWQGQEGEELEEETIAHSREKTYTI